VQWGSELIHRRVFNMSNTFGWVEIRTKDMEKTADFYERLVGRRVITKDIADGLDVLIFDTGDEPRIQNLRRGGIWLRPKGEPLGVVVYSVNSKSIPNVLLGLVAMMFLCSAPKRPLEARKSFAFSRDFTFIDYIKVKTVKTRLPI
jgi:predicted enzyme related to lactoylglutathione lyase